MCGRLKQSSRYWRATTRKQLLVCVLIAGVCACSPRSEPTAKPGGLVFLTRDWCPDSERLKSNLDAALAALHNASDYPVIDVDTLPASDPRGGYPTPTLLYANRDVFGMVEPPLPHEPAT